MSYPLFHFSFLGQFRLFKNHPLDPQLGSAWLSLAQLGSAWLSLAQLGLTQLSKAIGSILALKFIRSLFCSNTFEFFHLVLIKSTPTHQVSLKLNEKQKGFTNSPFFEGICH